MPIPIKNPSEIKRMRDAGYLVGVIHARIQEAIAPGVTTAELDTIARDILADAGAKSSFLGYPGISVPFPATVCTSVNEEIVHGIPSNRRLRDGDIVSVDVGAIVNGYHGDSAWTYPVGTISPEAARLLDVTEASLYEALAMATAGNRLGAVSHAVERYGEERGFGIVREYGGHGIGRRMHEDPHIPNHGDPSRGVVLRRGMTFAIEPMLTSGSPDTRVLTDDWTVVTADGSLAAHFEHTVAIADDEAEILTKRLVAVVQ